MLAGRYGEDIELEFEVQYVPYSRKFIAEATATYNYNTVEATKDPNQHTVQYISYISYNHLIQPILTPKTLPSSSIFHADASTLHV